MRLKDRVAIVTGGARGIGKAVAKLFANEGAHVVIWDLLDATEVVNEISSLGGSAEFTKLSVADGPAVEKEVARIIETSAKIDILINNAGILRDKTLVKMSDEDWNLSIDVNLTGVFKCTRAVVPHMKNNQYGRIISASSIVGLRGNFGQTNYVATKAGIIGMTKTWALELGKYGITTNAIAPGLTMTEMVANIPEETRTQMAMQIPSKFIAHPIDIAHGYLFLASDEARFVNGICLPIDGGFSR